MHIQDDAATYIVPSAESDYPQPIRMIYENYYYVRTSYFIPDRHLTHRYHRATRSLVFCKGH